MPQATSATREIGAEAGPFLGPAILEEAASRSWSERGLSVLRLLRPLDSFAALAGSVIGAQLAGLELLSPLVLFVALSNLMVLAASMAFNDWHDVVEDAINRPHAPLAAGQLSRSFALRLSLVLFMGGVVVAALAGPLAGILLIGFNTLSLAYTLRLKSWPLVGNLLVAVLSSYPLWCWMLLAPHAGETQALLCLSCVVFCLGREILGTARDVRGDRLGQVSTVATRIGARRANVLGVVLIFLSGAFAAAPIARGEVSPLYLALFTLAFLLGLRIALTVVRTATPDQGGEMSGGLVKLARWITAVMAVAYALGTAVVHT